MRSLDPDGKRALFESPPAAPDDALRAGRDRTGKDALYSTGPPEAGTAVVSCSHCKARSRVSLADVALRKLTLSVWIPGRRHPHWMRCPACGQWRWCRVGWTD